MKFARLAPLPLPTDGLVTYPLPAGGSEGPPNTSGAIFEPSDVPAVNAVTSQYIPNTAW